MTTQAETSTNNGLNTVKWVFALSILIAATVGNRYAPELFPSYLFGCAVWCWLLWRLRRSHLP
jgi:hypothetical protein